MREAGKNTKRINVRRPVLQAAKLRYISLASLGLICLLLFLLQLATSASQSSSREFNGRAPRQAVGETHVSNADLGSSKAMRDASLTPLPSSTTSTQGSGIQIPTRLPISSVNSRFKNPLQIWHTGWHTNGPDLSRTVSRSRNVNLMPFLLGVFQHPLDLIFGHSQSHLEHSRAI